MSLAKVGYGPSVYEYNNLYSLNNGYIQYLPSDILNTSRKCYTHSYTSTVTPNYRELYSTGRCSEYIGSVPCRQCITISPLLWSVHLDGQLTMDCEHSHTLVTAAIEAQVGTHM